MPLERIIQHATPILDRKDVPDDVKQEVALILSAAQDNVLPGDEKWRWIDSSHEPMMVYDNTLLFTHVNAAAVEQYGYAEEEFRRLSVFDIRPAEDHDRMRENLAQVPRPEITGPSRWRHIRKNGETFDVEIISTSYPQAGRDARLVLARDVSKLRKREEHLRQIEMLSNVGLMTAYAIHDLNNALQSMDTYTELHSRKLQRQGGEQFLPEAQVIRQTYLTFKGIVSSLADLQHRPTGAHVVDVNRILERNKLMLDCVFSKAYRVVTDYSSSYKVRIDPFEFGRVTANLAANARDAMPQGGTFTITTADIFISDMTIMNMGHEIPGGEYVQISYADTGIGMTPAHARHIFDPFYTTKDNGTGLGLPCVSRIVKDHGGYLDMHTAPGKGTRFDIFLPRSSGS